MKVVVSAAQFAPETMSLEKAVNKAVDIIAQAAKEQSQLVVFPETWLLGYPYWASMGTRDPLFQAYMGHLMQQAGPIDDPRLLHISKAAAKHKVAVVIGMHEQDGGSLYNTQLLYGPDGVLENTHRKLIPTNTEKLVWGQGDGSDLAAVDMGFGKVGGLICFEHQMTLARYAMCSLGEQIHCAQWPGHAHITPMIDASMRQLAHENGCFVVSAREVMSADRLPADAPGTGDDLDRWHGVGGSAIIAPNATNIAVAAEDEEVLLTAQIDLSMIGMVKYHLDNVGHYTRPDVFQLFWDDSPKPPVVRASEVEAEEE